MIIVGIDEVGRGCWAGPLVAGAVILNKPIAGLKDSKKLTKKQREKLAVTIHAEALAVGLGWVDPTTIDKVGLTEAVSLAMHDALAAITQKYDQVIVDGNYNFLAGNPKVQTLVKADDSIPAVSAASIIAKVARDQYMANLSATYPDYGFEQHVGYGTALHAARLKLHGVSDQHRRSFKPIRVLLAS
jgi:ribonuclease HII